MPDPVSSPRLRERALVTGGTGFVGSHLVKRLLNEGWEVHLLLRPTSDEQKIAWLPGTPFIHRMDGNITSMLQLFERIKPDIVFHIAAQISSTSDPLEAEEMIRANILMGTQLLEAMARNKTRYFVNTGSFWQHDEKGNYHPVNLYAATKQAFEDILLCYQQVAGIRAVTLKLFDVYGPGDTRQKLFQFLQKAAHTGQELAMTPGEQYMDLVYIDDVVSAYFHAAGLLKNSPSKLESSYAVRSSHLFSLREVVALYERLSGSTLNIRWGGKPYRVREIMHPWQGPPLPGWKPLVNLEAGIRRLISENLLQTAKNQNGGRTGDA